MTQYNTHTLGNGLRIIHRPTASPVIYCGFQIAAGSRHEQPGEEGLAHFCEHVTFKGTRRRRAWHILNCLESVGGDLNAFTTKESTVYYAAVLREHLSRAVDLLCDIVLHSTYPQHEIDKEIAVICDEIESYNDTPAELIYDEFERLLFGSHPLGHNILGQASQLRTYTTADALRFTARHYCPHNMIFFIDGDIHFGQLVKMLQRNMDGGDEGARCASSAQDISLSSKNLCTPENIPSTPPPPVTILEKHTHQAHVMMGCRAYEHRHPRRMALFLLNNMLGGPGMNARLNLSLREHHGLVYTVESTMVSYSDQGLWCTYFGCDPHDVDRCRQLVSRELQRFVQQPLTPRQLSAAKKQLKVQIGIACENREQFALDFGKSFLTHGWERDVETLFARIDAVTADDIQQVAQELFAPERLSTLIIR
jgi:predicted Zn-dependent peptidase